MNREEIFAKLHEIFHDILDDDSIVLNNSTTAEDVEDWDSLVHINLIVAIEEEFDIKFTMDEVLTMKNIGSMADIILERI